jgi:hypothetical protein
LEDRPVKKSKSAKPEIVTPTAPVEHREPVLVDRAHAGAAGDFRFWPPDRPLPTAYVRPPIPCPACRRVLTDSSGRAARVTSVFQEIARFSCVCCGHTWKLKKLG